MFTKLAKIDDQLVQNSPIALNKENEQLDGLTVRSSIRAGEMTWDDNLGNVGDRAQELLGGIGNWVSSLGQ